MHSNFNDLKNKTMTGREYINKEKPNLVDNWSYPADLLSYGQIAEMLEEYHQAKLKLLGIGVVVERSEQFSFNQIMKISQNYDGNDLAKFLENIDS